MGGAHLQCVKNHHVKYEYKGMTTVGVAGYTNYPLSISDVKNVQVQHPLKMRKKL